eukprot:1934038-Pyramimonas_sp.AAC.1
MVALSTIILYHVGCPTPSLMCPLLLPRSRLKCLANPSPSSSDLLAGISPKQASRGPREQF